MNGVELPCGSIIQVEPAVSSKNSTHQKEDAPADPKALVAPEREEPLDDKVPPLKPTMSDSQSAADQLDDFFASLE
jgi:hypothetical protein